MPRTVTITVDPVHSEPLRRMLDTEFDCLGDSLRGVASGGNYEELPRLLARLELATNARLALSDSPDSPVSVVVDPEWLGVELLQQLHDLDSADPNAVEANTARVIATGRILEAAV